MNSKFFAVFAAGALMTAAAFYAFRPTPPRPAVPLPQPPQPIQVAPAPAPVPVVAPVPQPKPKSRKAVKRFAPKSRVVNASFSPSPTVITDLPPELSTEIAALELPEPAVPEPVTEQVREPRVVTIPEKTPITIRLGERLASDRNIVGDAFFATLDAPLVVDGWVIAERGARILGRVTDVEQAGKVKGVATLTLELTSVTASDGQRIPLRTARFIREGDTSKKSDVVKVGIGAVLGTVIGAASGGGKGAAIGAASGAAAGAGAVALTRGKAAVLDVETRMTFQLERGVTVTERQ